MSRRFIKPRIDRLFKDAVEGLIDDLSKKSRVVAFLDGPVIYCNNCVYDPVHKASSGVYNNHGPKPFTGKVCPVCQGKGTLPNVQQIVIPSIVQWSRMAKDELNRVMPEGMLPEGHARIKAKVRYLDTVLAAKYFTVDGFRCRMTGEPVKKGLLAFVEVEWVVLRDD